MNIFIAAHIPMAKNDKNYKTSTKKTIPAGNKQPAKSTVVNSKSDAGKKLNFITAIIIAVCGMLLYSNTLNHDYVLDDFSVIAENKITVKGSKAIGVIFQTGYREGNYTAEDNLYRPLTKAMFAVEYEISGGKPGFMHWINVITYGLLCGFIFLSLRRFIPGQYYLAIIAGLLFAFHPIHTEVVANIKSRDEIMALFSILGSLWFIKSYVDTRKFYYLILAMICYFIALFAKESSITYVALAGITMYFLTKASWKDIGIVTGAMLIITAIYLSIHLSVIGSIGLKTELIPIPDNSIMQSPGALERKMTAIEILGRYLKLLFFPHPLSSDYSFNTIQNVKSPGNPGFLLSLVIHLGMLVYAIWGWRRKLISSYAIFFYFITLSIVSNVFMYIGTNMAERLIFMPSLGFCLLIAFLINKGLKLEQFKPTDLKSVFRLKPMLWFILIPLLFISSLKTIDRNKDWKNVSTLFNRDIKTVPNSVHMLLYHAGMITNTDSLAIKTPEDRLKTLLIAEKELLKADSLWEPFPNGHSLLGRVYKEMGQYYAERQMGPQAGQLYNLAIKHYKRTLELNSNDPTTYNNYATCFFATARYDSAEVFFKKAIEISPICYADALANLGSVYGTFGAIYRSQGNEPKAVEYFNKAIGMFNETLNCDKDNIQAYQFLSLTYINLGDTVKAKPYTQRYNELMQRKQDRLNKLK